MPDDQAAREATTLDKVRREAAELGLCLQVDREPMRAQFAFAWPVRKADCWRATLHDPNGEPVATGFGSTGTNAALAAVTDHRKKRG